MPPSVRLPDPHASETWRSGDTFDQLAIGNWQLATADRRLHNCGRLADWLPSWLAESWLVGMRRSKRCLLFIADAFGRRFATVDKSVGQSIGSPCRCLIRVYWFKRQPGYRSRYQQRPTPVANSLGLGFGLCVCLLRVKWRLGANVFFVSGPGSGSGLSAGGVASASRCGHGLYNCRQLTHVAREATCHWLHSSARVCHLHHSLDMVAVVVVVFTWKQNFIALLLPRWLLIILQLFYWFAAKMSLA